MVGVCLVRHSPTCLPSDSFYPLQPAAIEWRWLVFLGCGATMNPSQFFSDPLRPLALMVLALVGCGQPADRQSPSLQATAQLPDIFTFITEPSDRFLVDVTDVSRGHPFLGVHS